MKSKKKLIDVAKSLFRNSLTEGAVDPKKVRLALLAVKSGDKTNKIAILKIYKKLISQAIAKEEIILETGSRFKPSKKFEDELLAKTGAKRISYKLNGKLVFGAKITHGDWIFDSSLPAKLERLTINN